MLNFLSITGCVSGFS
jgi:hypothetical protein